MNKKLRLALLSGLTMLFVLSLSFVPVFAEEVAPPIDPDPILVTMDNGTVDAPDASGAADSGVVPGSEGSTDPVPAEDDIKVDPIADDGTVNVLDDGIRTLTGTDATGGTDESLDDPLLGVEAYQTLGGVNSATTPWLLIAGVALAGLAIGFGAGFMARRPKKVTTV